MATPISTRALLAFALVGLIVTAALLPGSEPPRAATSATGQLIWNAFLFALPMGLAVSALIGVRWTFIASVMYGTIGLALDVSTMIQDWNRPEQRQVLLLSGVSAALNVVLIIAGGAAFLNVHPDAPSVLDQRRPS